MAGIVIGIVLVVLAPIGLFVAAGWIYNQVDLSTGYRFGGQISVDLLEAQPFQVSVYPAIATDCVVIDPSGNSVPVNPISQSITGDDGSSWLAIATFTTVDRGKYQVGCTPPTGSSNYMFVIVPTGLPRPLGLALTAFVIGGIGFFIIGVVLIIVTGVRRGKWTRTFGPPPILYGQPMLMMMPVPYGQPGVYGQPVPYAQPVPYGQTPPGVQPAYPGYPGVSAPTQTPMSQATTYPPQQHANPM